ncbi:MAG: response regulator transcription factor [Oscillospiraceae bacterium]|nr:response regulator transcription factor [Oscillospiraceae bacterium]
MEALTLHVAVAEDEKASRRKIVEYLQNYQNAGTVRFEISEFEDGEDLVNSYQPVYDIIFLDIEMPKLDGMKAAEYIRQKDEHVILVFITNVARYAVKGYEVQALDYILKPVSYESFSAKLDRVVKMAARREEKSIVINTGSDLRKVPVSHILYVEVLRHQVVYHLEEGEVVLRGSLKDAEDLLNGCGFEKCNSCYLVNLRHVRGIRDGNALVGSDELQISRARKKPFLQALTAYIASV